LRALRRRRGYRPKEKKRKGAKMRRHSAYTIAELQKKRNPELYVIAQALAVDCRTATGKNKEALGVLISYIAGLVEKRGQ